MEWRHVLVSLLLLCNVTLYLARANVSIAILYMMKDCDPAQKWVLASFYFGYFCLQLFGGYASSKKGGYTCLRLAATVWTIASLACVPAYKYYGSWLLILCRFFVGLAEGVNYPSQATLAAKWFPQKDKTTYWSLLGSGEALGTILAMATSPFVATAFGWEWIFYISGAVGCVWTIAFSFLASNDPDSHPMISQRERDMIVTTRPPGGRTPDFANIPWRRILTHRPFLATCVCHWMYNYSAYFALSLGPTWFKRRFDVDISNPKSGLGPLACAPYIVQFVIQPLVGLLADRLVASGGWWTLTRTRKFANTFGMLSYALFFGALGVPVVQERVGLGVAVALFSCGIAFGGAAPAAGYWANYSDLSPRYAGVLIGFGNTGATIPGILGNLISGTIVGDGCDGEYDDSENDGYVMWSLVFSISSILSILGAFVFVRYGSATRASFDDEGELVGLFQEDTGAPDEGAVQRGDEQRAKRPSSLLSVRLLSEQRS